ncbi:MAG: toll/interleukin-1 receptor domain-containing protein [Lachnospiraceae bacterium]|nr:toll/interleukin-1 receptor domain-containing protein [Lachnospiraceae bacterium]
MIDFFKKGMDGKNRPNCSMETKHYDAFISYRHCELDKFVAVTLHKKLEAFKLPNGVESPTGLTRISRVFRDQDELPLSSNLSEPITRALENSDFLIVICTPRLKESEWCRREMETFIKLHGRERVLAVLAEGEPRESFPEVLTKETLTYTDEQGNIKTKVMTFEPLAADVRGKSKKDIKKAIHDAVLHIAAAIFNLNYDDLRQRHKERKFRQTITVVSAVASAMFLFSAVCLGLLFKIIVQSEQIMDQNNEIINQSNEISKFASQVEAQNTKIKEQYNQAQRNYAIATADNADKLMSYGRRMDALYALRSVMPASETDTSMPYTTETHRALFNALQLYSEGETFNTRHTFECESNISYMRISPNEKYILAADSASNLNVWEVESGNLVYSVSYYMPPLSYSDVYADFANEETVLYLSENGFVLHDLVKNTDAPFLNKNNKQITRGCFVDCKNSEFFIVTDDSKDRVFNVYKSDSFAPVFSISEKDIERAAGKDVIEAEMLISTDGNHFIIPVYPAYGDVGNMKVMVYDMSSGELASVIPVTEDSAAKVDFSLYLCCATTYENNLYLSYIDEKGACRFCSINISEGTKNWDVPTEATATSITLNFDYSKLYCPTGSLFFILDANTGRQEKIMSCNKIVDIKTYINKEGAILLDYDGDLIAYNDQDELLSAPYLTEEYPETGFVNQGYYFLDGRQVALLPYNSDYIIYYSRKPVEEQYANTNVMYYETISKTGENYISVDCNIMSVKDNSVIYETPESYASDVTFIGDGSQYALFNNTGTIKIIDFVNKTEKELEGYYKYPVSCDHNFILSKETEGTYTVSSLPDLNAVSTIEIQEEFPDDVILINQDTILVLKIGQPFTVYRAGQSEPIYKSERVLTAKEYVIPGNYKDMFVVYYRDGFIEAYEVGSSVEILNTVYNTDFTSIDSPIYVAEKDCYIIPGLPETVVYNNEFKPILSLPNKWCYIPCENNFVEYEYGINNPDFQVRMPFWSYNEIIKKTDGILGNYRPSARIATQYNINVR